MIVGLLCALLAALAYGTASVLQSAGIRRAGAAGGSAADLAGLRHQPMYFIGLGLDGLGFVAMVLALQFLPLFLVQAVVAASVGVTAVIAALTGTRLGRSGWIALAAAGLGLVLLSISAAAENATALPLVWRWVLLALTAPVAAVIVIGPRLRGRWEVALLAFGAGLGFTVVAISSRTLDFPSPVWRILLDPALWAVIASGIAGTVLFAMALQAGAVTTVSAITFTTETVIPAGVGLAFLGDAVRPGFWPAAAAGFVLAVAGAVALSRYAEGLPSATGTEHDGSVLTTPGESR